MEDAARGDSTDEPLSDTPPGLGWRLAWLFVHWRWFVEMCKLRRRAAVARVVLQRRPLDAATIDHVLSYLSADTRRTLMQATRVSGVG